MRYLIVAAIGHLVWEAAQLPLYTIWWTGTARENFIAVVHCTGGDVLITTATLLTAGILARLRGWHPFGSRMVLTAIGLGVTYTIMSEWLNVAVWHSWSYSSSMPVLPWLGTGLSPFSNGWSSPRWRSRSAVGLQDRLIDGAGPCHHVPITLKETVDDGLSELRLCRPSTSPQPECGSLRPFQVQEIRTIAIIPAI